MFEGRSGDIDVLRVDVIWPGVLAENLVDLKPYFSDEELAAHFPGYIQNNTIGDAMVAIAFRLGAGMLYYRTDLLEKYGFDGPPATWDDLTAMATTIQEGERAAGNADFWGFVWQGNNYEGLTCNALEWQLSEGAGAIVSPEGEIQVNNDAMIGALERAAGWVGTISPPGVLSYVEDDARAVWHAGNAAFMRNWPYAYSVSLTSEAIGDVFAVSALPAGDSGTYAATMGGWSIGVNRYSENVEAAVAFAKHFASYQEQKRRAISSSINPTIAALYQDADVIEAVPIFAGLDAVFMGAAPRPSTVTGSLYNQVSTLYSTAVHDVLSGDEDAATAMTLLELDLQALLGD
jgi:trehalose/maltose transport system substrate-binding protein